MVSSLLAAVVYLGLFSWGAHDLVIATGAQFDTSTPRSTLLAKGLVQCGGGGILFLWWRWQRHRFHASNGTVGSNPTILAYQMFYGYFSFKSVGSVIIGVSDARGGNLTSGVLMVAAGMLQGSPSLVVCVLGRERMFDITAKRFARAHAVNDGAFIAQLLDTAVAMVGDTWWVHRDNPNESFGQFDPRRNWLKGVVEMVGDDDFSVLVPLPPEPKDSSRRRNAQVSENTGSTLKHNLLRLISMGTDSVEGNGASLAREEKADSRRGSFEIKNAPENRARVSPDAPTSRYFIPITNRGLSAEQLMSKAVSELRCIDWKNFSRQLLASSTSGGDDLFTLSRPVRPGEQVDYFMSHSCECWWRLSYVIDNTP